MLTGRDEQELKDADAGVRRLLSFYGSTPAYRVTLDAHGWGDLQTELNTLSKQGRWDEMTGLIDDEIVDALAVRGEPASIGARVRERYGGLADRISFSMPYEPSAECMHEVLAGFRADARDVRPLATGRARDRRGSGCRRRGGTHARASGRGSRGQRPLRGARADGRRRDRRGRGTRRRASRPTSPTPARSTRWWPTVEARLGPVDILVNNAGIPADGFVLKQFREMTVDDWEPFIRLNLYGTLHCTRAVVDGMCERGWGRVVTVSSEAGRDRHRPRHLALRRRQGGRRRAVPSSGGGAGPVRGHGELRVARRHRAGRRRRRRAWRSGYPTRRLGRPADVAGAIAYLASDEAAWVTGQTLPVNGGIFTS